MKWMLGCQMPLAATHSFVLLECSGRTLCRLLIKSERKTIIGTRGSLISAMSLESSKYCMTGEMYQITEVKLCWA